MLCPMAEPKGAKGEQNVHHLCLHPADATERWELGLNLEISSCYFPNAAPEARPAPTSGHCDILPGISKRRAHLHAGRPEKASALKRAFATFRSIFCAANPCVADEEAAPPCVAACFGCSFHRARPVHAAVPVARCMLVALSSPQCMKNCAAVGSLQPEPVSVQAARARAQCLSWCVPVRLARVSMNCATSCHTGTVVCTGRHVLQQWTTSCKTKAMGWWWWW